MLRKITEADGDYFVSDMGNVYSGNKKLQYRLTKNGYARVQYKVGGKYVDRYVHRLVASYFIPNPTNYRCVNHKDGNKKNNRVDNLEWCNHKQNMKHASLNNLINRDSENRREQCRLNQKKASLLSSRPMLVYNKNGEFIEEYPSGTNALYRPSYKGCFYRDKFVYERLYGQIPKRLPNFSETLMLCSHRKRIFIGSRNNEDCLVFYKLSELPITREQFYYVYNHSVPDKNGYIWSIKLI